MRSAAGPWRNVVDRWMGGATAPVSGSVSAPACTARVSSRIGCTPLRDPEGVARGLDGRRDLRVAMRAGNEAGLECRGRQVDAALEHGVEEAVERGAVAGHRLGVGVDPGFAAEEQAEHATDPI